MKPIRLSNEILEQIKQEFDEQLEEMKIGNLFDGEVKFVKKFVYEKTTQKAKVVFSVKAYLKMLMLLNSFNSEVAWHGFCQRTGDREFTISDIIVYPQTVTGSTVNTDQENYTDFMMKLTDKQYNTMHMQGHSHVDFSTTPSTVDINHQEQIIRQLGKDDFYIFMIFNKRLERTIKIYDMPNNILYENDEVEVDIQDTDLSLLDFLADAQKTVKTVSMPKYTYPVSNKPHEAPKVSKTTKKKDVDYDKFIFEERPYLGDYYGFV